MTARVLMIQGTASYAGKTVIAAAFCRIFSDLGYRVAPFKAQNMSLNSYVTPDGLEISRAQALQALAARTEPHVEMNPILLKPKGEKTSQVVLQGKPYSDLTAERYYSEFALSLGWETITRSLRRLMEEFDVVVIEGAGSPAEVNLYDKDVTNMKVADLADAPVLLVGDIDRGGVFASLLGTLQLLRPEHQNRIQGLIVNKFRGDASILMSGLELLRNKTGKPVLGVIPLIEGLELPGEDSMSIWELSGGNGAFDIAVIRLPLISNFTDLDPLAREKEVSLRYVQDVRELGEPDLVILPGTKNSMAAARWLWESGLARALIAKARGGVPVIGVCGGYQILGRRIVDSSGIEDGHEGSVDGLGLLRVETTFTSYSKQTRRVSAEIVAGMGVTVSQKGAAITGYEVHMGETMLDDGVQPVFKVFSDDGNPHHDGCMNENGLVLGTYLHGLFDDPPMRLGVLQFLSARKGMAKPEVSRQTATDRWEESLMRLVKVVKENLDMKAIMKIVGL